MINNMSLYEQLKTHIEQGKMPITQNDDGEYCIYLSITSENYLRCSYFQPNIDDCVDTLGVCFQTKPCISWKKKSEKIVGFYQPKIKEHKVGDRVDILESAKECDGYKNWEYEKREMVGMKGFYIKEVVRDTAGATLYLIWNKDKTDCFYFQHQHIAHHFPDNELTTSEQEAIDIVNRLAEEGKVKNKVELVK